MYLPMRSVLFLSGLDKEEYSNTEAVMKLTVAPKNSNEQ